MKIEIPQVLWHNNNIGRLKDNGKNDPLLSCSLLESGWRDEKDISSPNEEDKYGHVLATSSNTSEVHLWKVVFHSNADSKNGCSDENTNGNNKAKVLQRVPQHKIEHLLTLTRHERSVNATAFSPNGIHLVTAGDNGSVIVWSVPPSKRGNENGRHFWGSLSSSTSTERDLDCRVLSQSSDDVMDVCWSADSKRFVLCSLDHCVLVYEDVNFGVQGEESKWSCVFRNAKDHLSYVQGVAYDPLGVYVASQGSDRTVRIFSRKALSLKKKGPVSKNVVDSNSEGAAQHARGKQAQVQKLLTDKKFEILGKTKVLKYRSTPLSSNENSISNKPAENHISAQTTNKNPVKHHLYAHDSTVESFFRRLAWTGDGAFLITPAALYHVEGESKDGVPITATTTTEEDASSSAPTFATYLFARHQFDKPFKVFAGLEKPSVVVRPNPLLFKLPKTISNGRTPRVQPYRSIFAVLTLDCVLLYDTYHDAPIAVAQGLHYSGLTDCTWSSDGLHLIVTSTDGYISILSFESGELGEVYENSSSNISSATSFTVPSFTAETNKNQDALDDEPSPERQLLDDEEEVTLLVPSSPPQQSQVDVKQTRNETVEGNDSSLRHFRKKITPTLVATSSSIANTISFDRHNEPEKKESAAKSLVVVAESTDEEGERRVEYKPLMSSGAKRSVSDMIRTKGDADIAISSLDTSSPTEASTGKDKNADRLGTETEREEMNGESKQRQMSQPKKKKRIQPMLVSCK